MKRLFAAIKTQPDQEFINRFRALRQALMHHKIKWVEEENIHITIKFFGQTEESRIPVISDVLNSLAGSVGEFSFRFEGLGIFGSSYSPRILWVAIHPNEELSGMMKALQKELEVIGFPSDRQNAVPHLTLGRIRSLQDRHHFQKVLDSYRKISSQPMTAGKIILFESILMREGPEYQVVKSFPLKK